MILCVSLFSLSSYYLQFSRLLFSSLFRRVEGATFPPKPVSFLHLSEKAKRKQSWPLHHAHSENLAHPWSKIATKILSAARVKNGDKHCFSRTTFPLIQSCTKGSVP